MVKTLVALAGLIMAGQVFAQQTMSVERLHSLQQEDRAPLIIDVRSEQEYLEGHVPGAMLIPHEQIADYADTLAEHSDSTIVLYCASNRRAELAADTLRERGFADIRLLEGAFPAWEEAGKPVE